MSRSRYDAFVGKAFPYPIMVEGYAWPQHTSEHVLAFKEWELKTTVPPEMTGRQAKKTLEIWRSGEIERLVALGITDTELRERIYQWEMEIRRSLRLPHK